MSLVSFISNNRDKRKRNARGISRFGTAEIWNLQKGLQLNTRKISPDLLQCDLFKISLYDPRGVCWLIIAPSDWGTTGVNQPINGIAAIPNSNDRTWHHTISCLLLTLTRWSLSCCSFRSSFHSFVAHHPLRCFFFFFYLPSHFLSLIFSFFLPLDLNLSCSRNLNEFAALSRASSVMLNQSRRLVQTPEQWSQAPGPRFY